MEAVDTKGQKSASVAKAPYYRLYVYFKDGYKKPDKNTGELREKWFWNSDYLLQQIEADYRIKLNPTVSPVGNDKINTQLVAIKMTLSKHKGKFNRITIYNRMENGQAPILFEWTPGQFICPYPGLIEFLKPSIV